MIRVVAGLIRKDGKYLIGQRTDGNKEVIGKWEFMGGTVEKNENDEDALKRELYEELSIKTKIGRFITHNICKYPTKTIDLNLYEVEYLSGDITLHKDHSDFKWVSLEELDNFLFCEADEPLKDYVIKNTLVK